MSSSPFESTLPGTPSPSVPSRPTRSAPPAWRPLAALAALAGALALASWSCASDKPTGPPAAADIKIMDTVFLPPIVTIDPGQTVEWVNRSREHRTVTSGLGPGDPAAGLAFDEDLAGYKPGEPDGGHFRKTFAHSDTVRYFSRLSPSGFGGTITGTIIIR